MAQAILSAPLQAALDAIHRATDGIGNEQLVWHPEGKWSSAEILEHLLLTYTRTADRMKTMMQQGKPEARRRTFREWLGRLIVLKLGRIPTGRKSPEAVSPKGMAPEQAMTSIRENLIALDHAIDECEQRFGSRQLVLVHAVLGPLSTAEWRRFHCVHTQHHMRQIENLRQQRQQVIASRKAATN